MTEQSNSPVDPAKVLALHERGFTQAQVARALHTSAYYVRKAAREVGVVFDGSQTEAARAARACQARAERDALGVAFRAAAREGLVMAMDRRLRPVDRKWAVTMAAIAADKDMALEDHSRRGRQLEREEEVERQIGSLTGFGSIINADDPQDADDPEDEDFPDADGPVPDDRGEPP